LGQQLGGVTELDGLAVFQHLVGLAAGLDAKLLEAAQVTAHPLQGLQGSGFDGRAGLAGKHQQQAEQGRAHHGHGHALYQTYCMRRVQVAISGEPLRSVTVSV